MSDANERFEARAKAFYADTGMMAPGKDCAAAGYSVSYEERQAAWRAWCSQQVRIETLEAESQRLREAAQYVHDDLKLRAVDGVVAIGNGAWIKFKKALQQEVGDNE